MKTTTAYCPRCGRVFEVEVTEEEFKNKICYDECECGKSGAFGLDISEEDRKS